MHWFDLRESLEVRSGCGGMLGSRFLDDVGESLRRWEGLGSCESLTERKQRLAWEVMCYCGIVSTSPSSTQHISPYISYQNAQRTP